MSGPGRRPAADPPLSLLLRRGSAADHHALERRIGSRETAMTLRAYMRMLLMFRALHRAADAWRDRYAAECQRYGIRHDQRRLDALIDGDLRQLDLHDPQDPALAAVAFPADHCTSFAGFLGALYVVEGSALGNVLVLRQVQASLGDACRGATGFLAGSAQDAGAAFQALRLRLDAFGLAEPDACPAVIDGARNTFRACADICDRVPT